MGNAMRVMIVSAGIGLFLTLGLGAQEKVVLTVAETVPEYRLNNFVVRYDDPATPSDEGALSMDLVGAGTATVSCVYSSSSNPTASFLINALNKANLSTAYAGNASTGSLKQRIFHRLVVMGESTAVCGKTLTGTLQGTPQ